MEPTVTITLKEVETLKSTIENLKREVSQLKSQKDFRITIDGTLYDDKQHKYIYSNRVLVYGHLEQVTQNGSKEVKAEMNSLFNKLIEQSIYIKFYRKFPIWVHKIFKCN